MDQAQLLSIIGSVYDKFVADVSAKVEANLINMIDQSINVRIQEKIDGLTDLDTDMIREIARGEIENADVDQQISDWIESNFDIDDHLDLKDKIDDYLSDRLSDLVKDEVRDLSFTVTLD